MMNISSVSRSCRRHGRGMALLLVMVGMVVCTILTAGFLASQGTSIGIARNERDAQKCRVLAQTGVDMCYWLIRNKSNWRSTMPIGSWLNAVPIGDGVVSATVADGDSSGSFIDDPTQSVVVSATGAYDNRAFTLTATVRPTGGGTVFNDGNFIVGKITVGNTDLLTGATVDSYNSNVAAYSSGSPGSNASFGSGSLVNQALTVYFPSIFRGSYTGASGGILSNLISLVGLGVSGPSSTSTASEPRNPGTAVFPNITGLVYQNTFNPGSAGIYPFPGPGRYDSVSAASSVTINIKTTGIYYVTGNFSLNNASSTLTVDDGVSAVVVVNGNTNLNGKITLTGAAQLALYCNNPVTITGTSVNLNGNTSHFTLFGGANCSQIQMVGAATMVGSVFAPQTAFVMQTGSPKFYGALIAGSLLLKNTSQLHFDEALRSLRLSNITGGSAPSGSADYRLTIMGGSGLH